MNITVQEVQGSKRKIFRLWLEFLKPYHKLRPKEMEALSIMLHYRHKISMAVSKDELIDELLFSPETRLAIREELDNMPNVQFHNLLTGLRKKGVLTKSNRILKMLVPPMGPDDKDFKLVFSFEANEEDIST